MALGLILSSSDIAYNVNITGNSNYTGSNIVGWPYGQAALHSKLSNPITSSGDFARAFVRAAVTNSRAPFAAWYVSSSVDGAIYQPTGSDTFSTSKAYSMRAWLRVDDYGLIDKNVNVGLFVRGQANGTIVAAGFNGAWQHSMSGYNIRLGGTTAYGIDSPDTLRLTLGTARVDGDDAGVPAIVNCSGSYAMDTWYRVRLDVVPVGSAGDTINVYTSSAGDVASGQETWELVGTRFADAAADSLACMTNRTDMAMG